MHRAQKRAYLLVWALQNNLVLDIASSRYMNTLNVFRQGDQCGQKMLC